MNRKDFLSLSVPFAGVLYGFTKGRDGMQQNQSDKIPPFLQSGDTIAITCPSGFITLEECMPAIQTLEKWGLQVQIGKTVGTRNFAFSASDEARIEDFQAFLNDGKVKAILFGRGGYGAARIIDRIDFSNFTQSPKWIIGFSDATVVHAHLYANFGIASLHSKMCNSFPSEILTEEDVRFKSIESIRQCLFGEQPDYPCPPSRFNRIGTCTGDLIGGNLSLVENLCGSKSDVNTDHKILFLEDVGEYLYKIDSMFTHLKRNGKLKKLNGLILGNFRIKPDDPGEEFGATLYDIVLDKVKDYAYPVCFDFPVGHVKENYALIHGMRHELKVQSDFVTLKKSV